MTFKTHEIKPPTTTWYQLHHRRILKLDVARATKTMLVIVKENWTLKGVASGYYELKVSRADCYDTADAAVAELRRRLEDDVATHREELAAAESTLAKLNAAYPPRGDEALTKGEGR